MKHLLRGDVTRQRSRAEVSHGRDLSVLIIKLREQEEEHLPGQEARTVLGNVCRGLARAANHLTRRDKTGHVKKRENIKF